MFDANVANAAGCFTADADAGEAAAVQFAMRDDEVFGRLAETSAVEAAAGFEADGVVAGVDIATVDANVFAGIDVDAVAVAPDGDVFNSDIGAIGGMRGPIAALGDGKIFPADVVARDRFEDDNAARILTGSDGGVAFNAAGTDDADVIDIGSVDERTMAGLPAAFPADVEHGIVGQVGAADDDGIFFELQNGLVAELDAADQKFSGGNDDRRRRRRPRKCRELFER